MTDDEMRLALDAMIEAGAPGQGARVTQAHINAEVEADDSRYQDDWQTAVREIQVNRQEPR